MRGPDSTEYGNKGAEMSVHGKTVMITGASRGIGAAAAELFASEGANVVLVARSLDAIEALAEKIGAQAMAVACDVGRFDQVEAAVVRAVDHFGAIDIQINNAGVIEPISHLSTSDPKGWAEAININLNGVYYGMRAVLPGMVARGSGTILNVSSGAAHGPVEAWSHYCASKAGAAMLTRCADLEHRDDGLRIMGLSPGTVATEMQREIKASGINRVSQLEWSDHIPADWPAKALLWMCSADADEFLGQEIALRETEIRQRSGCIS